MKLDVSVFRLMAKYRTQNAIEMMEEYLIGILPRSERAYYSGNGWTEIW